MDILGETFLSKNYGEFKVVAYESSRKVRIKFKNTGYERFVAASHIKAGEVKDKCSPSIHGVACIGDGPHKTTGRYKSIYCRYQHMIERCYVKKSKWYSIYGGVGVRVSDFFLNYQNYADWFISRCREIGEDPFNTKMQVDKDFYGSKVYGPDSCILLTPQENSETSNSKRYNFEDENGKKYSILNMSKFCRDKGLNCSSMISMCGGKLNFSQGFSRVGDFSKPNKSDFQCDVKGVIWNGKLNKWESRITKQGKRKSLGFYSDMFDAICARKSEDARFEK